MKKLTSIIALAVISLSLHAQIEQTHTENGFEGKRTFRKHEIGFSIGVFPLIGGSTGNTFDPKPVGGRKRGHVYDVREGGNFEKMYHFGSYNLNYNYHFNSRHSLGVAFSWVGKHVDINWVYPASCLLWTCKPTVVVAGSGWVHYFTYQVNYRFTYYRKDNVSLFLGVYTGTTKHLRDKEILPEQKISFLLGSISNDRWLSVPAGHITVLGVEVGEKNVFNMELGAGSRGILQLGFKHKF